MGLLWLQIVMLRKVIRIDSQHLSFVAQLIMSWKLYEEVKLFSLMGVTKVYFDHKYRFMQYQLGLRMIIMFSLGNGRTSILLHLTVDSCDTNAACYGMALLLGWCCSISLR